MNSPSPKPAARDHALDAAFVGPSGENGGLLEKFVVEFLRDHVYWRRNFHPDDPPAIASTTAHHPDYLAFESRTWQELHALSAQLKKSVPFHSPRYIGHMASDLLLPGLAAQMLALPYNPNNVTDEVAPVTIDMELRVGLQLARMLGFVDDPARPDCAFGHLTSGGTVANYQALRLALAMKAFPVALRAAGVPDLALPEDDWRAFNLPGEAVIVLLGQWRAWLAQCPAAERQHWREKVRAERIEQRGLADFFAAHPELQVPRVLAPITAHYSWSKGLKLLGLGRAQLDLLPTIGMRLDGAALAQRVDELARSRTPVLMAVAVLGSTEYGTIDPVDAVLDARRQGRNMGLDFAVHVDAAWGGYLTTIFRNPDGSLRSREAVAAEFKYFPTPPIHRAFAALAGVDSVTVDPHKLGYLPFGSGAFVCRDHRAMALLAERADYVFHGDSADGYFEHYRGLGQFIPEGSKPGAAAAGVYVAHRVLPLDHENFGRLPRGTVRATEIFYQRARRFIDEQADRLTVRVPFEPDSNLVCLALNLPGNRSLARANDFVQRLYADMRADPDEPLQVREFFGSVTTLRPELVGAAETRRILLDLGIEPELEGEPLTVLRHTLMNPYLIDQENGISYIERYFDFLARRGAALAHSMGA